MRGAEVQKSKKRVITAEEWESRCAKVTVANDDLDTLVMNFLVTEGYLDAAKVFQEESGTVAHVPMETSADRMHIRNAVETGHIEEAVERINDLNPEILEENSTLFFKVQLQQLIEFIRDGKVEEALSFAQEYLACKGEDNPAFLDDLESTIALIAFADPFQSPVAHLMDVSQRQQTASALNAAILAKYNQESEPRLTSLMKMLVWGQQKLSAELQFPQITDLSKGMPT